MEGIDADVVTVEEDESLHPEDQAHYLVEYLKIVADHDVRRFDRAADRLEQLLEVQK